MAYTGCMHIIDRKWTELAAGYQSVRLLQASLETEFGHAFQAGQRQTYRRKLAEWQKKRRAFFVMAAFAPLSLIMLSVAIFYFREAACVIIYWILLVMLILVTLVVAGRNTIREMINRPTPEKTGALPLDLEQRWWASIAPKEIMGAAVGEQERAKFLALLGQSLPKSFPAIREPYLLTFSPAGLWLFQVEGWSGTILREEGAWKQVQTIREKGKKQLQQVQALPAAPDEAWLRHKKEILNTLNERLPQQAWTASLIQGGVVFTHPQVVLDKEHIQGNMAAFGPPRAWIERVRNAAALEDFTLERQLEILDALHTPQEEQAASSAAEAERLYHTASDELRQLVAKLVA
jgi:hypothetical protein